MKLFELYWSWYEDYESYLFVHPDKSKTQEDFERDARSLYRHAALELLKTELGYIGLNNVTEEVAERLPELGYVKVEPVRFGSFGGYILKNNDRLKEDESETAIELIGMDAFLSVSEHNLDIENSIRERRNPKPKNKPHIP